MATITISRQNGKIQFDPPQAEIGTGDVIVFRNEDPESGHLITRQGEGDNFWFQYPMAPFVGQPADTSDEVLFNSKGTVTYVCATAGHAGESGTIVVS